MMICNIDKIHVKNWVQSSYTPLKTWVGQNDFKVMDQNSQNIVLTNNPRTARPTYILLLRLSFFDNLL